MLALTHLTAARTHSNSLCVLGDFICLLLSSQAVLSAPNHLPSNHHLSGGAITCQILITVTSKSHLQGDAQANRLTSALHRSSQWPLQAACGIASCAEKCGTSSDLNFKFFAKPGRYSPASLQHVWGPAWLCVVRLGWESTHSLNHRWLSLGLYSASPSSYSWSNLAYLSGNIKPDP